MGAQSSHYCCVTKAVHNAANDDSEESPKNKVQLAVSAVFGIPGVMAYHSSVVLNGEEYFFSSSDCGICTSRNLESHEANVMLQVLNMGFSKYSGVQLMDALSTHFRAGTYDLLSKNCNSFSDCALFFLLEKRLDFKYCMLERLGATNASLISLFTGGQYSPNPKAASFDKEKIIAHIEFERAWNMIPDQQATCCPFANKVHQMRLARLRQVAQFAARGTGAGRAPASAKLSERGVVMDVEAPAKPATRSLTKEEFAHFEEHGYMIGRGIMSAEVITSI